MKKYEILVKGKGVSYIKNINAVSKEEAIELARIDFINSLTCTVLLAPIEKEEGK